MIGAIFEITSAITVTGGLIVVGYGAVTLIDHIARRVRGKKERERYYRARAKARARHYMAYTIEK